MPKEEVRLKKKNDIIIPKNNIRYHQPQALRQSELIIEQ